VQNCVHLSTQSVSFFPNPSHQTLLETIGWARLARSAHAGAVAAVGARLAVLTPKSSTVRSLNAHREP